MRKWHRWFSLFAGVLMIWMSVTGLVIHIDKLTRGEDHKPAVVASADKPAFVCPPDYMCRPRPKPGKLDIHGLFMHLHSGEIAGPVGTVLSIASGFSLLFFSISGFWMYVQMWRFRAGRGLSPRWLWK